MTSSKQVSVAGGGSLLITLNVGAASAVRGAPVPITLIVKNTSPLRLYYGSGAGPPTDAAVRDSNGTIIWDYNNSFAGGVFDGPALSLGPGESFTDDLTWDQTEQGPGFEPGIPGPYAPPGQYSITAWFQPGFVGPIPSAAPKLTISEAQAMFSPSPLTVTIQNGVAPVQPQPAPVPAPQNLTATVSQDGISLDWTLSNEFTSFNIYRRTAGMAYGAPLNMSVGRPPVPISDGTPGVTYFFVVRGVGFGNVLGPPSNEVSAIAPVVSNLPPGPAGSPDGPIVQGR
ncbi:MAG: hypothetical protein M3Y56_06410 [Armatimonadota bacterium]|nr:hypothetical protein [Armatimonadota bacterium]